MIAKLPIFLRNLDVRKGKRRIIISINSDFGGQLRGSVEYVIMICVLSFDFAEFADYIE